MAKPKTGGSANRKSKSKQNQQPTNADEYLAQGVEHEEAAEKWRAGDAIKSMRFYERALNIYNEALSLFPTSFDLAYNKYGYVTLWWDCTLYLPSRLLMLIM